VLWDGKLPIDEAGAKRRAMFARIRCHEGAKSSFRGNCHERSSFIMFKFNTKTLTILGLLVAVEIVLSRFLSISAWNIKIGFSFVPIALAAILYGPLAGGLVAAVGDFLGAVLFPIGPYFPGFTFTAFLTGMVFGLFLHKKQNLRNIAGAVLVNQLIMSLLLNTLWISILYGSPFLPLLETRVFQAVLLGVVQFVVIRMVGRLPARIQGTVAA